MISFVHFSVLFIRFLIRVLIGFQCIVKKIFLSIGKFRTIVQKLKIQIFESFLHNEEYSIGLGLFVFREIYDKNKKI